MKRKWQKPSDYHITTFCVIVCFFASRLEKAGIIGYLIGQLVVLSRSVAIALWFCHRNKIQYNHVLTTTILITPSLSNSTILFLIVAT